MSEKLDSFLNRGTPEAQTDERPEAVAEAPVAEAVTEVEPAPSAEEQAATKAAERARKPKGEPGAGQFVGKGAEEAPQGGEAEQAPETPAATPAAEEETGTIPVSALKAERTKRQAAENELRELRERLAAQPQAPAQPQPAPAAVVEDQGPPDRWLEPEAYDQYLVAKAAEAARSEAVRAFQNQRVATSCDALASTVPDYADKMSVFVEMCNANPALEQQLYSAENPAKFAYDTASIQLELNQHGGLEGLIAARVQEALRTQAQPAQVAAETPVAPSVPDTLAAAQSSRGTAVVPKSPSLTEILRR